MKRFIIWLGILIVIGLVVWAAWFLFSSQGQRGGLSSLTVPGQSQSGISAPVQKITSPQNPAVAQAFLAGIQNASSVSLGGTIVVSQYALQVWADPNEAGEAFLKQSTAGGWTLVTLGGGQVNVLGLLQEGIPLSIAEQLAAAAGVAPIITSSSSIPSGDVITVGTAHGGVVAKNFYNNPVYFDSDENTVVLRWMSDYSIAYNTTNNVFTINLFTLPLDSARQAAEASFLDALNIGKIDACKLNVYEVPSGPARAQYAGRSFSFSFCQATSGAFSEP